MIDNSYFGDYDFKLSENLTSYDSREYFHAYKISKKLNCVFYYYILYYIL